MIRNEMGIVVLDNYNKVIKDEVGRKQKNWLESNGKEYLLSIYYIAVCYKYFIYGNFLKKLLILYWSVAN